MNHLDVGLDKGRSKTNLVVARADGHLLLEARIEHFDQIDPQPGFDDALRGDRVLADLNLYPDAVTRLLDLRPAVARTVESMTT